MDCDNFVNRISNSTESRGVGNENTHSQNSSRDNSATRGTTTSFGFRRRPTTAIPVTEDNSKDIDTNGNGEKNVIYNEVTTDTKHERVTSRLPAPKKEAIGATRTNRFGFRQNNAPKATNKVSDIDVQPIRNIETKNNNIEKPHVYSSNITATNVQKLRPVSTESNRVQVCTAQQINAARYKLQTTNLPMPQMPVRVYDTKGAKQAANNSKRIAQYAEGGSSKEGSLTEDSGVGSHTSGPTTSGDSDTLHEIEVLDSSPVLRSRPRNQRTLEMIVTGKHFDLRDVDESSVVESTIIPLPRLPSVFDNNHRSGVVRERAMQYQRQIEQERRKISTELSRSSDYEVEEKVLIDNRNTEKKMHSSRYSSISDKDVSPSSSDEQEWGLAGEALAEEFTCSLSSSDESKDREQLPISNIMTSSFTSTLQNLMTSSLRGAVPKQTTRDILLTIEDPKFAAVAAASSGNLLDDETSPVDSLVSSCTESNSEDLGLKIKDKLKSKMTESTNSKDICEKGTASPTTPGTPTNASNSLSLSDGRDYFDDEIADQPGLVFDDTVTASISGDIESEKTMKDSENKKNNVHVNKSVENSPAPRKIKNVLMNRTVSVASVDTLSPCESIASDDLMMDYEVSQSSGLNNSMDRLHTKDESALQSLQSLEDVMLSSEFEIQQEETKQKWSSLTDSVHGTSNHSSTLPMNGLSSRLQYRARLYSDTPRCLENNVPIRSRPPSSGTHSPLNLHSHRRASDSPNSVYDSDDSMVQVNRSSYTSVTQDIVGIKTMLLKLKRVLHESETLNPFENSPVRNGHFNGIPCETEVDSNDSGEFRLTSKNRIELADLRRQVVFLQAQLEDRERTVQELRQQVAAGFGASSSAPNSICEPEVCNAATQTERIRPMSAGPSLFQGLPTNGGKGPLVSLNESTKKYRSPKLLKFYPAVLNVSDSISPCDYILKPQGEYISTAISTTPTKRMNLSSNSSLMRRSRSNGRCQVTQLSL